MASSRQLGVLFCFGFKTAMFFLFFRCIPSTAETVIEILKSLNLGFAMASVSQIESHISCNRSCVLSFPSKVFLFCFTTGLLTIYYNLVLEQLTP